MCRKVTAAAAAGEEEEEEKEEEEHVDVDRSEDGPGGCEWTEE